MDSYSCTHCGHGFQSESVALECPECFWSSAITKTDAFTDSQRLALKNKKTEADLTKIGGTLLVVLGFIFRMAFFIGLGFYGRNISSDFANTPFSQLTPTGLITVVFGWGMLIYCAASLISLRPISSWSESDYDFKLLYQGWGSAGLAVIGLGAAILYLLSRWKS